MVRFTPDFLDDLKSRLRPSDVIGKTVKLKKQGNEWAGLSPFTKEKTPSFFVNDQKGFYHCFSSGNHGDIISFLQETERLSFHEAVERLAADAGLPLPVETPAEAARAEKAKGLADACADAAKFFAAMLRRQDGRHALEYLYGRDVSDEEIEAFGVGYAPGGRSALKDALINKGYREETLVDAGLLIKPEDGGSAYDRFRNRVMFPIIGARKRVIAFGGRALEKDAKAKYLNSPETPIFHKGSVLYNLDQARASMGDGSNTLIVCEGYMDVVALWGAGFKNAVAPLGTALTEDQLAMLWRACDEPMLCFDGDKAGLRAAYRGVDRALPLLKPGKSLRFAFLPEGVDPDDLVRKAGASAFAEVIENTRPLADVLWTREREARPLDTPERRAALRSHLRQLVKAIADKDVRNAYAAELARRLDQEFAPPTAKKDYAYTKGRNPNGRARQYSQGPMRTTGGRMSSTLRRRGAPTDWRQEAGLVLAILNHPVLLERQEAAIFALELDDEPLSALLGEILSAFSADPGLDRDGLKSHLRDTRANGALERVVNDAELSKQTFLRPETDIEAVERGFLNTLAHHLYDSTLKQEVTHSATKIFADGEDPWKAAATARDALLNTSKSDDDEDAGGRRTTLESALERMRRSVDTKHKG
ncbi:MAG: DNA primase [Pseudomonadota bacterium]